MSHVRYARLVGRVAIALSTLAAPHTLAAQELVIDGGFENPTATGSPSANWSVIPNGGAKCWTGVSDQVERTGTYGLFTGPENGTCTIRQSLATTIGADYTFSFWLRNLNGSPPNTFAAQWGANTLLTLTNAALFDWTK
ncbi:MAG: hypothetical protein MUF00_09225 [Gemmatimonadaceae bacterium]|jgi:hypothetical protein|nr:hypothetical protein [Gemmatimonadaceae bacterium]